MSIKHRGLKDYRFSDNPEERRFADAWATQNARPNNAPGTLAYMLGDGHAAAITDRDALVAATVVQWLGSPVGQSFLSELGYAKIDVLQHRQIENLANAILDQEEALRVALQNRKVGGSILFNAAYITGYRRALLTAKKKYQAALAALRETT